MLCTVISLLLNIVKKNKQIQRQPDTWKRKLEKNNTAAIPGLKMRLGNAKCLIQYTLSHC